MSADSRLRSAARLEMRTSWTASSRRSSGRFDPSTLRPDHALVRPPSILRWFVTPYGVVVLVLIVLGGALHLQCDSTFKRKAVNNWLTSGKSAHVVAELLFVRRLRTFNSNQLFR